MNKLAITELERSHDLDNFSCFSTLLYQKVENEDFGPWLRQMPWLRQFHSHLNKLAIVELERSHLFGNTNYLHSNCCKNTEWQMITFIWNYPCSETIKHHLFLMCLDPIFSSKQLVSVVLLDQKVENQDWTTYKDTHKQGYIKVKFPPVRVTNSI